MIKSKVKIIVTEEGLFNIGMEFHNLIVNDESIIVPILDEIVMESESVNLIVKEMSGKPQELDYLYVILETKNYIDHKELVCIANNVIKKIISFNNSELWKDAQRIADNIIIPKESVETNFNSEYLK